ncbi:MAG: hypothetical protein JO037_00665 [Actinobacteria bacterium]|nr:hypothetical protein [Actinomycetota bacterium]
MSDETDLADLLWPRRLRPGRRRPWRRPWDEQPDEPREAWDEEPVDPQQAWNETPSVRIACAPLRWLRA